MARRAQFRDEDLVKAARAVFLARGARATTAEVAERAGVSEGTIFHHFKTKEALFRAAIHPGFEALPEVIELPAQAGKGEVAGTLLQFAGALLESLRQHAPIMMLAWANAAPEERRRLFCEADPLGTGVVRSVAIYLEAEVRLGRLRRFDAEIAARVLVSGIFDYVRSEIIADALGRLPLPAEMYVRGLIDMFLHGALPRPVSKMAPRARAPRRIRKSPRK